MALGPKPGAVASGSIIADVDVGGVCFSASCGGGVSMVRFALLPVEFKV